MTVAKERGNHGLRWLDRYLGIPLLAVRGAFRRRRAFPDRVRRIGILKLTAIGDTVLLAGVVRDVAAAFPDAELVMFTGPINAAAARLLEGPRELVTVRTTSPPALARELRRHRLDLLVDFGPWSRLEAAATAHSGASFTVGFRTPGQFRHWCQDLSVDHSSEVHEIENYRRLVGAFGVVTASAPRLRPPGLLSPERLPRRPFIVFHPWPSGFRSELKEWPSDRWIDIAQKLARPGLSIVLTGGPADVARSHELAKRIPGPVVDTAGKVSIAEVLDLVSASECVISVNTGVMHLAALGGVPTVGLNGPSSDLRWGPIGERAVGVNSSFDDCGYLNLGGEYRGQRTDCMLGISVESVVAAVLDVTSRPSSLAPRMPSRG